MKFIRITLPYLAASLIASFSLVFCMSASAQYMWLDAAGRKVFSDQPPPNSIPVKRILQKPENVKQQTMTAAPEVATDVANSDKASEAATMPAAAAPKPVNTKDKELEAAKKKLDDEAAAKKKAEDDARNVARADNCQRAKQAKMQFETGRPISTVNAKGERIIMDEAARMVETKRIEGIMAADCR